MKKVFSFILISGIISLFSLCCTISIVNADTSGTGGIGTGQVSGGGGSGTWNKRFGFFIAVFDSNHNQIGDTKIVKVYDGYANTKWLISSLNGWITKNSTNNWSTNPTKLYDYLNIPYSGSTGTSDYTKLKEYINEILGPDPESLKSGDYVLIEPFTQIDGNWITFRGIITNISKVYYKNENGETKNLPFHEWYKTPAKLLANSAKVGDDIKAGDITYKAPSGACDSSGYGSSSEKKFCGYNNNKYIGYGIVVVREDQINTDVKKYYLDLNGRLDGRDVTNIIGYGTADIYIDGKLVANDVDDYWTQWPEGTNYEITDIKAKDGKKYDGVYSGELLGTINAKTVVTLEFSSIHPCSDDFKNKVENGLTIQERLELFNTWQFRNLLDFSYDTEAEAEFACTTFEHSLSPISGCISGSLNTNFNSNNLHYYDEIIDLNGVPVFCGYSFNINNNIGVSSFPTVKSGMLILGRDENNKTIANGTITKTCYTLYDGDGTEFIINSYSDYISDEKLTLSFDGKNQIEKSDEIDPILKEHILESGLNKYVIEYKAQYNLKPQYAKLGSGEILNNNCSDCRFLGYGIYSKLVNNTSGTMNFSYTYNGDQIQDGICTYNVENEVIKNDKLNIEFRTFENNNAFPGKDGDGRIVGSNWCNGSDCNSTNALIANIMANRNDSYNKMNSKPLYRIVLTPSLIQSIREYNKDPEHPYDDYTLECDANNKCKSKFLEEYGFLRTTEEIQWLEDYEEIIVENDSVVEQVYYIPEENRAFPDNNEFYLDNNKFYYIYEISKKYGKEGEIEQYKKEMEEGINNHIDDFNELFRYLYEKYPSNSIRVRVSGPGNPYYIEETPTNTTNTTFTFRIVEYV